MIHSGSDSQSSNGITESGNTLTLDLTNSTFSGLSSPGDFINLNICRCSSLENFKYKF
jgi:hypothetical protein